MTEIIVPDVVAKAEATLESTESVVKRSKHYELNHDFDGKAPYKCTKCDMCYSNINGVETHYFSKHVETACEEPKHKCTFCDRVFNARYLLQSHLYKHVPQKIKCPMCHEAFERSEDLYNHRVKGTCCTSCMCKLCGRVFSRVSGLTAHLKSSCPFSPSIDNNEKQIEETKGQIEKSKGRTYSKPSKRIKAEESLKIKCRICYKPFARQEDLHDHRVKGNCLSTCFCKLCGKTFSRSCGLTAHMKSCPFSPSIDNSNKQAETKKIRTYSKTYLSKNIKLEVLKK